MNSRSQQDRRLGGHHSPVCTRYWTEKSLPLRQESNLYSPVLRRCHVIIKVTELRRLPFWFCGGPVLPALRTQTTVHCTRHTLWYGRTWWNTLWRNMGQSVPLWAWRVPATPTAMTCDSRPTCCVDTESNWKLGWPIAHVESNFTHSLHC
jgi:hypothetical protein